MTRRCIEVDGALVQWAGREDPTAQDLKALSDIIAAAKRAFAEGRICRGCGCTDERACVTGGVPCHWVSPRWCSACDEKAHNDELRADIRTDRIREETYADPAAPE